MIWSEIGCLQLHVEDTLHGPTPIIFLVNECWKPKFWGNKWNVSSSEVADTQFLPAISRCDRIKNRIQIKSWLFGLSFFFWMIYLKISTCCVPSMSFMVLFIGSCCLSNPMSRGGTEKLRLGTKISNVGVILFYKGVEQYWCIQKLQNSMDKFSIYRGA